MASKDRPLQTVEWRCFKCRSIPWDCEDWELRPPNPVFESELQLTIDHHEPSANLEESVAAGCCLCRNLRARVIYETLDRGELPTVQWKVWFFRGMIHFQVSDSRETFEDLDRWKSVG